MKDFRRQIGLFIALIVLVIVPIVVFCLTPHPHSPNFSKLPHFFGGRRSFEASEWGKYRVRPYIEVAALLQSMGRSDAEACMMKYAEDGGEESDQIFILCRMLYQKQNGSSFRSPALGVSQFFGGTGPHDWPSYPIEIVDGVPFMIAKCEGAGFGSPTLPEEYLCYCETNCNWNTFRYNHRSDEELQTALGKMLSSSKWERPLGQNEQNWFIDQIQ